MLLTKIYSSVQTLLLKIHPLYAVRNARENLVRDSAEYLSHFAHRIVLAENEDFIALLDINSSNINHAHIHANISDDWGFLSVDHKTPVSVAQMPVDAIGITHGDSSHLGVAVKHALTVVADSLALLNSVDLGNYRLKGRGRNQGIRNMRHKSVKANAEANHLEIVLRKADNARTVEDMPHGTLADKPANRIIHFSETPNLLMSEIVKIRVIATDKM